MKNPQTRNQQTSPSQDQPTRRQVLRMTTILLAVGATGSMALSRSDTEKLFSAIERGDLDLVADLLDRSKSLITAHDPSGRSGYAASLSRQTLGTDESVFGEIAQLFLDAGYEPDLVELCLARRWQDLSELEFSPEAVEAEHPALGTAMSVAARRGIGSDMWRLYALGGNPNHFRDDPPLVACFEDPDLERAEMTAATLLGNGADPNARRPDQTTALHLAAERGSTGLVEMLIRTGAQVDARDRNDRDALFYAERNGHQSCALLLEEHDSIPRQHSTSRRAYDRSGEPYENKGQNLSFELQGRIVGVSHGNFEAVEALIEQEPRLVHASATTTEGAVEAGAHMGNHAIVDFLLERGAPYSLPTAVMKNDIGRTRALLDQDPLRIHERGAHGFALLWYPIIGGGHLDMAELLLDRGCQVEDQHFLGTTALHWAAIGGQAAMVELLLARGGDANRKGRKFQATAQSPIELAADRGHTSIVDLLRSWAARSA